MNLPKHARLRMSEANIRHSANLMCRLDFAQDISAQDWHNLDGMDKDTRIKQQHLRERETHRLFAYIHCANNYQFKSYGDAWYKKTKRIDHWKEGINQAEPTSISTSSIF